MDVGVIAVAAVLAGLMLNAGIKLVGSNREVTIQVALKFIAVVILMILFGPSIYAIELLGGIDISSLELNSTDAWVRWFMFLIAALSFYVGTGLFIVALVDMAFVLFRISRKGSSSWAMR